MVIVKIKENCKKINFFPPYLSTFQYTCGVIALSTGARVQGELRRQRTHLSAADRAQCARRSSLITRDRESEREGMRKKARGEAPIGKIALELDDRATSATYTPGCSSTAFLIYRYMPTPAEKSNGIVCVCVRVCVHKA